MGTIMQGRGRDSWTGILIEYEKLIPHYPGTRILQPASIPAPPKLRGVAKHDAELCFLAYHAAAHYVYPYPGRWRMPSSRGLAELGLAARKSLDKAAAALYTLGSQPHVWAVWSMRSWAAYGPKRWRARRPTMGWVYSTKRLASKNDFFVWGTSGVQSGAQLVFARSHKVLIAKWEHMRASLMAAHLRAGLDEERVREIVHRTLPPREYTRLMRHAEQETIERQAEIDIAFASGEYLWG